MSDIEINLSGVLIGKPAPHAPTHEAGGTDVIPIDTLGNPTDNTNLNVSTAAHGLTPKAPNDPTKVLLGDATWGSLPSLGGGGTNTYGKWMASMANPPASNYAAFDTVNSIPVYDFAQSVVQSVFFIDIMPQGANLSGPLIVQIFWVSSVTSGNVVWGAAFENSMSGAISSDNFGTQVIATAAVNGSGDKFATTTITLPNANLGGIAAEQPYRLQIQRVGTNGSDTLAGSAQLVGVILGIS